jgi:hypothetical protein
MAIIEPKPGKLFPEYLYQGSKGPAVNVLALLLIAYKYGDHQNIVLDGDYKPGGKIADAVNEFRRLRGLPENGNVDPQMRREFMRFHQLSFGIFTTEMFAGQARYVGPENPDEPGLPLDGTHEGEGEHDPAEEDHDGDKRGAARPDNWGVSG